MEANTSSIGSMIKLTSTNYSIWRPMVDDWLYCRDLFDSFDIANCFDDVAVAKPTKPEKMDEKGYN